MKVAPSGASTSSLECDARRINDAHAGEVKPGDIAVGVIIARTSEAFDFLVYAIASVVVFPKLVFSFMDPLTGTLYSFAIFALAFLAQDGRLPDGFRAAGTQAVTGVWLARL